MSTSSSSLPTRPRTEGNHDRGRCRGAPAAPTSPARCFARVVAPRNTVVRFAQDSLLEQRGFELRVPRVVKERCRRDQLRSRAMAMVGEGCPLMSALFTVGPGVRIHFPPPESLQTLGPSQDDKSRPPAIWSAAFHEF